MTLDAREGRGGAVAAPAVTGSSRARARTRETDPTRGNPPPREDHGAGAWSTRARVRPALGQFARTRAHARLGLPVRCPITQGSPRLAPRGGTRRAARFQGRL